MDPDTKIVLYCRTGGRSALVTLTLQDMGYTTVIDLNGGFKEWASGGNSFRSMHGENKVVAYQKEEQRKKGPHGGGPIHAHPIGIPTGR